MAAVLPPQLRNIKPTLPVSPASSSTMGQAYDGQNGSPVDNVDFSDRAPRRSQSDDDNGSDESGAAESTTQDQTGRHANSGPVRKRRRSRKGLDKRFECTSPGCGKSYSRAEHLYRHQLNHNSKQLYYCSYPNCSRTFVRGDLLKRHMDRHTAKGSSISRRDSMGSATHEPVSPDLMRVSQLEQYSSAQDATISQYASMNDTHQSIGFSNGVATRIPDGFSHGSPYGASQSGHQSPIEGGPSRPQIQTNVAAYGVMSPVSHTPTTFGQQNRTPQSTSFVSQHNVLPFNLPPSQYSNAQSATPRDSAQHYPATTVTTTTADFSAHNSASEMMMLDQMAYPGTVPVFGDGGINKSPYVGMPEDFMAYLFNSSPDGPGSPMSRPIPPPYANYGDLQTNPYSVPYGGPDGAAPGYFPTAPQQIMAVNNLLDQNVPEATVSDEKSQEIFEFIRERFSENYHAPLERQRDSILEGDRSDGDHMLSKRMMQAYIGSYWYHFSDQMPILHKPTFSPDKTPTVLLLAMMTIGAALLDRTHGPKVMTAGAKLSNFLAWHLRWEVFMDFHFRPPAKLWIFQSLILLELYEKMYSTRELHERAHIHHATTITLMRRGRSLIGKTSLDSPPNMRESVNGSRHSSTGIAHSPDDWWNQWITNEATRRAALAAFVVDSNHATMFGHSAVMVAHEMRLPLPCDESLWKATSSAEVGRIESNLMSQGIKPISFLEGLKRTLSNQEVRTNSFGRTVLMAGLLSVTWHMHQRDLQVNVLGGGVIQALGGRDKWRATLTRAYDSWRADFDNALDRSEKSNDPYRYDESKEADFNIVFESRTVLHHLAHMAMHSDIVDCQVFARAKRLLGRAIGPQEFNSAQRRIKDFWAPSARARDATYYAIRFLSSVLVPDEVGTMRGQFYRRDHPYEARDDVLLNRSWVLYFAALVVWCYGFALEGPATEPAAPQNEQDKLRQMREYLVRYGNITDPNELRAMKGINQNTALLMVLKDAFESSRWELLHEASTLLSNCILLNSGGTVP